MILHSCPAMKPEEWKVGLYYVLFVDSGKYGKTYIVGIVDKYRIESGRFGFIEVSLLPILDTSGGKLFYSKCILNNLTSGDEYHLGLITDSKHKTIELIFNLDE